MTPLVHRPARVLVPGLIAVLTGAACVAEEQPPASAGALDAVPAIDEGERYVDAAVDGTCVLDCPDPARTIGVLVECADVDAVVARYAEELTGAGFDAAGDRSWRTSLDDVAVAVDVLVYDDASTGPVPNVDPYTEPADVAGRCSVVTVATAVAR